MSSEQCGDVFIEVKDALDGFGDVEGRYECTLALGHKGKHQGRLTGVRHVDDWAPRGTS